jgi:hypothetical protein
MVCLFALIGHNALTDGRSALISDDAGFSSASFPGGLASSWPASAGVDRLSQSLHQVQIRHRQHSPTSFHDSTTASSSDEGIEIASMQIDPCHLDHDYSAWAEPPDWAHNSPQERPRKRRVCLPAFYHSFSQNQMSSRLSLSLSDTAVQ